MPSKAHVESYRSENLLHGIITVLLDFLLTVFLYILPRDV